MKTELKSYEYGGNIHEFADHASRNFGRPSFLKRITQKTGEVKDEAIVQVNTLMVRAVLLIILRGSHTARIDGTQGRPKRRSR